MNRLVMVLAAAVAVACSAETAVAYVPQSGERVFIGDHEFVIVSAGDYADWTNRVAKLETIAARRWTIQHSTESGRVEWHGKRVSFEVDNDAKTATAVYEDGYRHTEAMKPKAARASNGAQKSPSARVPARPSTIPLGAWQMRQRLEKARNEKPVEVTATFAPGGKVIKVEGGAK